MSSPNGWNPQQAPQPGWGAPPPQQAPQPGWGGPPQQQAPDPRQLFSGISNAKAGNLSNWVRCGHYLWRIDKVKVSSGHDQSGYLAIEMTCVWSFDENAHTYAANGNNDLYRPHQPGEQAVHLLSRKHQSFLGNVKQFVCAVAGLRDEQVDENVLHQIVTQDLLVGMVVETTAVVQMTRAGKAFTKINYRRKVPAAETKNFLLQCGAQALIDSLFPNQMLDKMAQLEGGQGTAAQAPQPAQGGGWGAPPPPAQPDAPPPPPAAPGAWTPPQ